jgi:hypothetical protein
MERQTKKVRGTRVAVYLPEALARRLRVRCASKGETLSSAVAAAVKAWLGGSGRRS